MKKLYWIAGLAFALLASAASAQSTVLGGRGGAPVRAEAPVTVESITGRWGDNSDCDAATEFRPDGSFASSASGEGRWTLSGDHLAMESDAGASEFSVLMMNADHIRFTGADGAVKISRRC